ncbi:SIR2 family protein [Undibacterium sp. TJN25]|uniref:SIR2 family protein n=1 Tax=Undibacterium sp. TJN25 TaxID=3413056 RepID=UPI003BF2D7F2
MAYAQYQAEITADIENVLSLAGCQPILFIGSGFSKRYSHAPNWDQLLDALAKQCPLIDKDYGYYKQKDPDPIDIGSVFATYYQEWAWGKGKPNFPPEYFNGNTPTNAFIKYAATQLLNNLGPVKGSYGSPQLDAEIAALKAIDPHAIITTNYDQLLEPLFPEYEKIIGQKILQRAYLSIGEIFKIHGCISDASSLVLTREDYNEFENDKKYLSAKLLTYFAEHPLLFVGYSAQDPNIKNVLYDISRMFRPSLALSPNIYILEWDDTLTPDSMPPRERVLLVGDEVEVRIKSISAKSFEWVFKAFGSHGNLEKVNLKALRSLMARTVNLVRRDIPSRNVEVNYQTLEHAIESSETFGNLLGVTLLDSPSNMNANYPYTPTMLADKLGLRGFNDVNKLIAVITEHAGVDIRSFDNTYHCKLKTGRGENSFTRKYSDAAITLLTKVQSGEEYTLAKDCQPPAVKK